MDGDPKDGDFNADGTQRYDGVNGNWYDVILEATVIGELDNFDRASKFLLNVAESGDEWFYTHFSGVSIEGSGGCSGEPVIKLRTGNGDDITITSEGFDLAVTLASLPDASKSSTQML